MKKNHNYLFVSWLFLAIALPTQAATSISTRSVYFDLSSGSASKDVTGVRSASWVSESMGYLGWTHFSKWGFMDLKKNQVVTITLDGTAIAGLHPATTVWYRKTKLKAMSVFSGTLDSKNLLTQMDDHFYKQSEDILVKNASNNDDSANPYSVGNFQMNFVKNALDGDGLGDKFTIGSVNYGPYIPVGYLTKNILDAEWIYDSTPGKVSLTFTAPQTGVYQFVIGALKPDKGSAAESAGAAGSTINVKVTTQ